MAYFHGFVLIRGGVAGRHFVRWNDLRDWRKWVSEMRAKCVANADDRQQLPGIDSADGVAERVSNAPVVTILTRRVCALRLLMFRIGKSLGTQDLGSADH